MADNISDSESVPRLHDPPQVGVEGVDDPLTTNEIVADMAPAADEESEDDYDPSNLIPSLETQTDGASPFPNGTSHNTAKLEVAKASATSKPRTVGGFAVESSDEEEEDPAKRPDEHVDVSEQSLEAAKPVVAITDNATPLPVVQIDNTAQDQSANPVILSTSAPSLNIQPVPLVSDEGIAGKEIGTVPPPHNALPSGDVPSAVPLTTAASSTVSSKVRLPSDVIGMLEDRVAKDPRGDLQAWQDLIAEYRKRNKIEEARKAYERFFMVFPTAVDEWLSYIQMENAADEFARMESIFSTSLNQVLDVKLWKTYLDYVRRRHNVDTDIEGGSARATILNAFKHVTDHVGADFSAGPVWQEYIAFYKSGPGTVGGSGWKDQQKTDEVRKLYHKAAAVPLRLSTTIWQEYHKFEAECNKSNSKKVIGEISPSFLVARNAAVHLSGIIKGLHRTSLPKLPPAQDHEGYTEYMEQLRVWQGWITYEKSDPLGIKDDDVAVFQNRIIYAYKQALMVYQFWPNLWFEAAEFCFEHSRTKEAMEFLQKGANATPESLLLAFKLADQVEDDTATQLTSSEEATKLRMQKIRQHFDKALNALYSLHSKMEASEQQMIAHATTEVMSATAPAPLEVKPPTLDIEMDEDPEDPHAAKQKALEAKIKIIKDGVAVDKDKMKQVITSVWIALMRASRRVHGKGNPSKDNPSDGFRTVFAEARQRGKINSQLYIEAAYMEWYCYQDPAHQRIFDRGLRLHPLDDKLALAYMKLLISKNDSSNARHVFETAVGKILARPEYLHRAKPLFRFIHEYDSLYSGLKQIQAIEKRMRDLWPEDPKLELFAARYKSDEVDPCAYVPIISVTAQLRPIIRPVVSIEESSVDNGLPDLAHTLRGSISSPKRPLNADDADNEPLHPRKIVRGESPLKGAAGRRLDASRRHAHTASIGGPNPLPQQLQYLFRALPDATKFIEHTGGQFRINIPYAMKMFLDLDLDRANLTPIDQRVPQDEPVPIQ